MVDKYNEFMILIKHAYKCKLKKEQSMLNSGNTKEIISLLLSISKNRQFLSLVIVLILKDNLK